MNRDKIRATLRGVSGNSKQVVRGRIRMSDPVTGFVCDIDTADALLVARGVLGWVVDLIAPGAKMPDDYDEALQDMLTSMGHTIREELFGEDDG